MTIKCAGPSIAVCAMLLGGALPAASQEQAEKPVSFSLEVAGGRGASARGVVNVEVLVRLDPGWYIYSLTQPPGGPVATRITVPQGQKLKAAGPARQPKPTRKFDENFGVHTESFSESVRFSVPVRALPGVRGKTPLRLEVLYQVCNDSVCLPPETELLETIVDPATEGSSKRPATRDRDSRRTPDRRP